MRILAKKLGVEHTFGIAYAPWSNGSVERICRSVLTILRKLCSMHGKAYEQWGEYLPAVQRIINTTRTERLAGRSPSSVMTTAVDHDASLVVLLNAEEDPRVVKHTEGIDNKVLEEMQTAFERMHKGLLERMDERRKKAVQRHNAKTNVQGINFGIGDFVLVGIADPKKCSKLALRWDGPAKVIELGESEQTFLVEDLLSGKARICLLYTSPSPRDGLLSRMPSSA